jgi:hypothetical protein
VTAFARVLDEGGGLVGDMMMHSPAESGGGESSFLSLASAGPSFLLSPLPGSLSLDGSTPTAGCRDPRVLHLAVAAPDFEDRRQRAAW